MNRRWMSFRRHGVLLMKYWPSPERNTRRVTVTSLYSVPSTASQSVSVRLTSAIASGLAWSVPLKITSVMAPPRSAFGLCSPSTQRIASDTLLLPQPFGPTIAIIPGSNTSFVRSAKLLNPTISSALRYTVSPCAAGGFPRRDTAGH